MKQRLLKKVKLYIIVLLIVSLLPVSYISAKDVKRIILMETMPVRYRSLRRQILTWE